MEELKEKINIEIARCENSIKARKAIVQNQLQIIAYQNVLKLINQIRK
jgi:uncharacterized protein (UPF0371 family)